MEELVDVLDEKGITDKEGCWEYLIKYYEMIHKNI